jgi:ribosomal protein S18 acetylase RimI-like enzyme
VSRARIRLAEAKDLPFLREMLFEAGFWRPGGERPPLAEALARPDLAKLLAGWGRHGDTGVIAEDAAARPVGAAWYRFWSDADHSYGYVSPEVPELGIAVRAEARGSGVGELLLRALLAEAGRRGVAELSLSVERDNPAARLYERVGFQRVGEVGGAFTMRAPSGRGSS